MNSKESSVRANNDLLNMIESWNEDGVDVQEGIFAGLTTFLEVSLKLAPSEEAFNGMLDVSVKQAIFQFRGI